MMCSYRATETGSNCEGEKTVVLHKELKSNLKRKRSLFLQGKERHRIVEDGHLGIESDEGKY
jgi:hypothetical protein